MQSLKGGIVEKRAITDLAKKVPDFAFEEAGGFLDEELRIDIVVKRNGNEVGGIQVKPLTFKMMRREVITFNKDANQKWGKPVFYLYYDDCENFVNVDELISTILKL